MSFLGLKQAKYGAFVRNVYGVNAQRVASALRTCCARAPYTLRFRRLPHWLFRWSFRPVFLFVKNKNVKTVPAVCFFRGECVFSRPQLIISHDLKLLMPWSNSFSGWFQPLPCWLLVSLGTFIAR